MLSICKSALLPLRLNETACALSGVRSKIASADGNALKLNMFPPVVNQFLESEDPIDLIVAKAYVTQCKERAIRVGY